MKFPKYEDFDNWLNKLAVAHAECDASCDYSRFLQAIKDEVSQWDTGVQEDGSI